MNMPFLITFSLNKNTAVDMLGLINLAIYINRKAHTFIV